MTHRNGIGKEGARIAIFRAYVDPFDAVAASQYVGPNNYFSLVWTSTYECCLYVHDEYTPGGHKIACTDLAAPPEITDFSFDPNACELNIEVTRNGGVIENHTLPVPELCRQVTDFTMDVQEEQLCITMSDDTSYCVDLTEILEAYIDEYDVRQMPDKSFAFFHGETEVIRWWQGGFAEKQVDGSVVITNPDETTVTIQAPVELPIFAITKDGYDTCLTIDGTPVGCWRQGDIVSEDTNIGVHYATKPDGSIVSWIGSDHITTASLDAVAQTVTIVNPDGQTITFPYSLPIDPGEQTIVSRGAGADVNLLTADHQGTAPNVSWRMPRVTRDGDVVTITIWDENDDAESVAIYSPEDVMYLIDPVFYIRQSGGSANPPINSQADLTVGNAFNNFTSLQTFIGRTIIIGSVTVDARGTFDFVTPMRPSSYANANSITYQGDPANPEAFTFRWDHDASAARSGFIASGGAAAVLKDVCCQQVFAGFALNVEQYAIAASEARLTLGGTIKLKSNTVVDADLPGNRVFFRSSGGHIQFGVHTNDGTEGVNIVIDYPATSALDKFLTLLGNGSADFAHVEVTDTGNGVAYDETMIRSANNSRVTFTKSQFAAGTIPLFTSVAGAADGIGPLIPTDAVTMSSFTTFRFGLSYAPVIEQVMPWMPSGSGVVGRLDKYSSMGGIYGTDLQSNARYQVV